MFKKNKRLTQPYEPLEYIREYVDFLGVRVDLLKKPLIPRPETAFWVEQTISSFKLQSSSIKVLDIFCGSGCIGLAVRKHIKGAKVFFADKYKYFKDPNFIKSDVFSNIKDKYDYIFANPPYVARSKKYLVQKSVLKYEPHSALFAGPDGMFYIKKFLSQARRHLNKNGRIFMEFSPEQKERIERLIKKHKYSNYKFNKDQFDRCRWVQIDR